MKFNLSLKKEAIAAEYQKILIKSAEGVTIKGFRKGKAPLNLVESKLDTGKLYEDVVNRLLPDVYANYIKTQNLKPIINPRIIPNDIKPGEDWEFEFEIAEKPEVKLGDYQTKIKSALKKLISSEKTEVKVDKKAKSNAEKDHEGHDHTTHSHDKEDKVITSIFDILISTSTIEIPQLLIDEEVNHALSQLVDQINQIGLNIDQYLQSKKLTREELKKEYEKTATTNLKLEFILDKVRETEKIEAEEKDLNSFFEKIKDNELVQNLKSNPERMASIKYSIAKQKTVDYLKSL